MRCTLLLAGVLLATTSSPAAAADPDWIEPVGIGLLEVAGGTIITGSVSAVSVAADSPSPDWAYASLGFGAGQAAIGLAFIALGAAYDDTFAYVMGGIGLGIGLFGLTSGAVTLLSRPEPDPGIPGSARPDPMPTMLQWTGRF